MKKIKFTNLIADTFSSSKIINFLIFLFFAILLTGILSAKYFLFQSIINDDNTSKKDIVAYKTIKVVDTFKTEQTKKEVAQKIEPVLTPAEDSYIKNNFNSLERNITEIRKKNIDDHAKRDELNLLFDIDNSYDRAYVLNYLINSKDEKLNTLFKKSEKSLDSILKQGVTEKDFEAKNIANAVLKNAHFEASKGELRVISALLEQVIVPNMIVDEYATEIARKNAVNMVSPTVVTFHKGEKIVVTGEPITKLKRDALIKSGYNVLELDYAGVAGIFVLVVFGMISLLYYLRYFEKQYMTKNYLSIIGLMAVVISLTAMFLPEEASFYYLPFPAIAILLAIFTNPRVSFLSSAIIISVISISMQLPIQYAVVFLIASLISTIATAKIRYSRRFDLIKIGLEIALAMFFLILDIYIIENNVTDINPILIWKDSIIGFINGILSGVIVLGTIPILESVFQIITPYGLAELADHNQKLLKRMQMDAPGTFAHCLMVSNLCESAAEAIGADPVLARVGALYHDIGKLKRPLFFVENQTYLGIENPHTKLNPRLSKMIITAHPKDGLDLAKEYGLPPVIQNFIIQHHGDSLAKYFYNQAKQEEGDEKVTEEQFRYSGPKPNTKETAILMIADAVESASRTLKDHSVEELDNMINNIIQDRLNDGQLSDSPLTLKDLKTIAATFSKNLRAAHHQRIKYHENIIQELEDKVKAKKKFVAPEKILSPDEEKVEKKIQKRLNKNNDEE